MVLVTSAIPEVTVRRICCICERVNEKLLRFYLFIIWIFSSTVLLQILLPLFLSLSLSSPPYLCSLPFSLAKGEQKHWFLHHPSSLHLHLCIFLSPYAWWNDPVSYRSVLCLLLRWRRTLLSGQTQLPSSFTCGRWRLLSEFLSHEALSCHFLCINIMVEQHVSLR